jgi:hypothetical protein
MAKMRLSNPGPRGSVPPTEETGDRGEVTRRHPAFGMIGAYRSTGGYVRLFGSHVEHGSFVTIKLCTAEERFDLHHEWFHADKVVAEVRLSEAQWATFVTAMNVGDGVPCTMSLVPAGDFELYAPPAIEDQSFEEKRHADIEEMTRKNLQALTETVAEFGAMLGRSKPPTKAELHVIRAKLERAVGHAPANYAFAAKSASDHIEHVVTDAKATLHAQIMQTLMRYPELRGSEPQLQLTAPEVEEEAVENEPIGALMEDGTVVKPWDERLRAAGGTPIYDEGIHGDHFVEGEDGGS